MYWYNPTTRASERVTAPSSDEEAVSMLAGRPDSARFVSGYAELRRSGAPIERGLVLVGHEERLREHELAPMRLAWRERPRRRPRPSAVGSICWWLSASKKRARIFKRGAAPGRGRDANHHVGTSEDSPGAKFAEGFFRVPG